MTAQTFEISVGLDQHKIDVQQDATSGKTMIRVDGRMAARPMSPAESSRELQVGPERYELHRSAGGSFELEFLGAVEQNMPAAPGVMPGMRPRAPAVKQQTSSFPLFRVLGALVAFALLSFIYPWVRDAAGIGWYHYDSPDGRFSFQMPAPPISERYNASGVAITEYSINVDNRDFYVGFAELPGQLPPGRDVMLINGLRDGLLKRHSAVMVSERTLASGTTFVAHSEKEKADFKFKIFLTPRRVYVAGAAATPKGLGSVAVYRFFNTFRFAD